MSLYDRLSSGIDRLFGVFSPGSALRRELARSYLAAARSAGRSDMYAAAKVDRLTGAWLPTNSDVNRIIAASSPRVRARVRQLVRDFPYFSRAVKVVTNYVVGSGITFQSRIQSSEGSSTSSGYSR
jgi:capsid protein